MADSIERGRREVAAHARELERSNEELDRFAAVTSHDLQAPLATISMYVQLLEARHGKDLGSAAQLVDGISSATGHARELIRGLLEYSRAGRGELRRERVNTERVVSRGARRARRRRSRRPAPPWRWGICRSCRPTTATSRRCSRT